MTKLMFRLGLGLAGLVSTASQAEAGLFSCFKKCRVPAQSYCYAQPTYPQSCSPQGGYAQGGYAQGVYGAPMAAGPGGVYMQMPGATAPTSQPMADVSGVVSEAEFNRLKASVGDLIDTVNSGTRPNPPLPKP